MNTKDKLQAFIKEATLEQMKQELGSAAYVNIAPQGQPALEGQVMVGADVRVLETMRNSVYDPEKDETIDAATVGGNTAANLLNRANHTGTQTAASISDFTSSVEDLLSWKFIFKTSTQTKTADTTLADDSTLVKAILAGEVLRLQFRVLIQTDNIVMGYKFSLNYTGAATFVYNKAKYVIAGGVIETILSQSSLIGSTAVTGATSGVAYVDIDVLIEASTSGTISFQWAQSTSNASNLSVLKGSYLGYALVEVPL